MNKQRLISEIQAHCLTDLQTDLTKAQIDAVLEAQARVVADRIESGDATSIAMLPGIGSIHLKHRLARKGRNPRTGAEIDIPAKWIANIHPAGLVKAALAKLNI